MGNFTASNEVILREYEAANLEKLFEKTTIGFVNYDLLCRLYDRVYQE